MLGRCKIIDRRGALIFQLPGAGKNSFNSPVLPSGPGDSSSSSSSSLSLRSLFCKAVVSPWSDIGESVGPGEKDSDIAIVFLVSCASEAVVGHVLICVFFSVVVVSVLHPFPPSRSCRVKKFGCQPPRWVMGKSVGPRGRASVCAPVLGYTGI